MTFQQTPCPPGQAAPAPAAPSAPSSPQEDDFVALTLLAKLGCDVVVPGFATRTAGAFAAWRQVRAGAVDRVEASADYRAREAESRRLLTEQPSSADVAEMTRYCEDQLLPLLAKEAAPADSRFQSPQRTFAAFVAALRAADRAAAIACLSDLGTDEMRDQLATLPAEQLRATGNRFVGPLVLGEMLGPLQSATAPRRDGYDHTVLFDRQPNGDWKIVGI